MEFAAIWKLLSSYGVLGIMSVVFMLAIGKLYRDREAERERHRAEMATEHERHRAEMAAYRDRYEAKAEKSAEKIESLARVANAAADAYARRRERDRRTTDADIIR